MAKHSRQGKMIKQNGVSVRLISPKSGTKSERSEARKAAKKS